MARGHLFHPLTQPQGRYHPSTEEFTGPMRKIENGSITCDGNWDKCWIVPWVRPTQSLFVNVTYLESKT